MSKRFTEAVKQLGDPKLEIRMGGIAGLWAVATESTHPEDRIMVLDVLCAFVRNAPHPTKDEPEKIKPDVEIAMNRLGSVGPYFPWGDVEEGREPYRRDFAGSYLEFFHHKGMNYKYSLFSRVKMGKSRFSKCDFEGALFSDNLSSHIEFYYCKFDNSTINLHNKSYFISCDVSLSSILCHDDYIVSAIDCFVGDEMYMQVIPKEVLLIFKNKNNSIYIENAFPLE